MTPLLERLLHFWETLGSNRPPIAWKLSKCPDPGWIDSAERRAFFECVKRKIELGEPPFTCSEEFVAPAELTDERETLHVDLLLQPYLFGTHYVIAVCDAPHALERQLLARELERTANAYSGFLDERAEQSPVIPVIVLHAGVEEPDADVVPLFFDAERDAFDLEDWEARLERWPKQPWQRHGST